MLIRRLRIRNVRNIADLDVTLGSGLNLVCGPNGAGKTALLEAVHLIARGRSFRTTHLGEIARFGEPGFQVVATVAPDGGQEVNAGVERMGARMVIRYGGEAVPRVSSMARQFPISLSTPDAQELIYGGPKVRRRWLDWSMFHVEHAYLAVWRDYHRVLRHRNILLKKVSRTAELEAFEAQMSTFAAQMTELRAGFVADFQQHLHALLEKMADWHGNLALHLLPGWEPMPSFQDQLRQARDRDAESGHTRLGPHRADLRLMGFGREAASSLSRGQSKVLVVLMALALGDVISQRGKERPVLLLDDPLAELDHEGQRKLLGLVADRGYQAIVSLPDSGLSPLQGAAWGATKVFHVKRGEIQEMLE